MSNLSSFTDVLGDEIPDSQPISLPSSMDSEPRGTVEPNHPRTRPPKGTGCHGEFRSVEEIDSKYRGIFTYPYFNLVQSSVIEDALYSDKSMVICAPTGSGKTVIFEMAIAQLLMDMDDKKCTEDFKIIYMAPVKALCTERLTEWYSKFTNLGILCIEVTGDTTVDITQLQAYKIIITTPEKWDMLTRRWRDHRSLVEMIKLFLIDEVHILNDEVRGPVLEAVVSRMKTIESSAQSAHRIEKLQKQYQTNSDSSPLSSKTNSISPPRIRFVAVSATVSNPEDVAAWLGTEDKPAAYFKFGDECRPVKLKRVVEGYPCNEGTSIFKFDIILNYKLWPIIQKYYDGKPTLIFCNTRKSVQLTAEALSREITITFNPEQRAKLMALASSIKTKKLQLLALAGVGCHHAGMLYEERINIELAFRNRDLPILITTTTLAMGVNLPAHLVIIKNTQQYVNGQYQEYSISTVLQMVGRAGRPQFDTEATAVIMTRHKDKARYQALVGGSDPLQSYLHKRLAENLNSEAALGTVGDVAQCVQWLRSTFLYVRAAKDPKRYLGLTPAASTYQISKKIEEICVRAMNGLASAGLISMDEASCIESTEAGRLMSVFYLDLETMKLLMKIEGNESLEALLRLLCECHELADMHLRVDERRSLNALNRNSAAPTIRYPMKGKISTRQMKLNCIIQAVLSCLPIPDPSLYQEAMKVMRIAKRVCKCLVSYVTRPDIISENRQFFTAILNSTILSKCLEAHLWEDSPFVSRQLKGIGPAFSTLLASAGKINFRLLEQSNPRDLERIMNKGPPAGNVLQKQVSYLPRYNLVATPINEKTMSVKLQLLNQAYLSENLDNHTAGEAHKCFIIAGDSENHVLLLSTFKDKDLISIYDGTVTFEITRKHNFEHTIYIHCVSLTYVGIDVKCEYTFINLGFFMPPIDNSCINILNENISSPQDKAIARTKERKRKIDEIAHSKEKKKRENALAEKIKLLKESFGKTSTKIKFDLENSKSISKSVLDELMPKNFAESINIMSLPQNSTSYDKEISDEDFNDFIDNNNIDNILNEIESEITSKKTGNNHTEIKNIKHCIPHANNNKLNQKKTRSIIAKKRKCEMEPNFKFMELLEKNIELSDEEKVPQNDNGFSESVRTQIEQYLQLSRNAKDLAHTTFNSLNDTVNAKNIENKEVNDLLRNKNDNQCLKIYSSENEINKFSVDESCAYKLNPNSVAISCINKGSTITTSNCRDNQNVSDNSQINSLNHELDLLNVPEKETKEEEPSNYIETPISLLKSISISENTENSSNGNFIANSEQTKQYNVDQNKMVCSYNSKTIDRHTPNIVYSNRDNIHSSLHILKSPIASTIHTKDCNITKFDEIKNIPQPTSNSNLKVCHKQVIETNPSNYKSKLAKENIDTYHRDEKTKKYTFSAERVHTQTKFTAYNQIKIVKRLKVDLDVTETVIENNIYPKENTYTNEVSHTEFSSVNSFSGTDETSINGDAIINLAELNKTSIVQNLHFNDGYARYINKEDYDFIPTDTNRNSRMERQYTLNPDYFRSLQRDSKEHGCDNLALYDKQNENFKYLGAAKTNYDVHTSTNESVPDNVFARSHGSITNSEDATKHVTILEQLGKNTTHNVKEKDENKENVNLSSNFDKINEDNCAVENILHKYHTIMRKSNTRSSPAIIQNINSNTTMKPFKSKKPFKISDIPQVNIPLSRICDPVQSSAKISESNFCMSREMDLPSNEKPADQVYFKPEKDVTINKNKEDLFIAEDELVKYNLSSLNVLETQEKSPEFNMDNSLFDPKRLLQCYNTNKTEAFPPPPPGFSDDVSIYSPEARHSSVFDDEHCLPNVYTSFESINDVECDYDTTLNINERYSEEDQTSSKQLETWFVDDRDNFDGDDQIPFNLSASNSSHSNYYRCNTNSRTHPYSRRAKLNQFKYNRPRNMIKR